MLFESFTDRLQLFDYLRRHRSAEDSQVAYRRERFIDGEVYDERVSESEFGSLMKDDYVDVVPDK